ncbi:hypothetical protein ICE98_01480 [Lactococcus lactis]|nr:hypothetical protein [Lactococcus lactis]
MIEFALRAACNKKNIQRGFNGSNTNENAIHFYKKLGFSDTGIFKRGKSRESGDRNLFYEGTIDKKLSQIYFFYFVAPFYYF